MGTTFGIPMNEPTRNMKGYEDFMKRKVREDKQTAIRQHRHGEPTTLQSGRHRGIDAIQASLGTEGFMAYCRGNVLKYNLAMRITKAVSKTSKKHVGISIN